MFIINPYFTVMISFMIAIASFFFPAGVWENIVNEENYMFLNYKMLFVFCFYILFLVLGIAFGKRCLRLKSISLLSLFEIKGDGGFYVISFISAALMIFYLAYNTILDHDFMFYTFRGETEIIKLEISKGNIDFATIPNYCVPFVMWCIFYCNIEPKRKIKIVTWMLISLFIFVSLVNSARYLLVPFLVSVFVVYGYIYFKENRKSPMYAFFYTSVFFLLVFFLFALISYMRDGGVVESLIGYIFASYNRLAAIVDGDLVYSGANFYNYFVPPKLLYYFSDFLGVNILSSHAVWELEFSSVAAAELNSKYIWPTQFGYAFGTTSYVGAGVFFLYGFICGYSWRSFKNKNLFGVIFYPLMYFSVLFSFGSFYFIIYFDYYFFSFIVLTGLMIFYNFFVLLNKMSKFSK